jgi:hypothetical protein
MTERKPMSIEEAYCAFPYQAICEDGMISAEEFEALMKHLGRDPVLKGHAPAKLLSRVDDHYLTLGDEFLSNAGAIIPAGMRPSAYRAAVLMAASDDDVGPRELEFLATAKAALRLSDADVEAITANLPK